jgi:hypothetical protein
MLRFAAAAAATVIGSGWPLRGPSYRRVDEKER